MPLRPESPVLRFGARPDSQPLRISAGGTPGTGAFGLDTRRC